MGELKFRLPDGFRDAANLRTAFATGLDRIPSPVEIEVVGDFLEVRRAAPESFRLHLPWSVSGAGTPIVSTATLMRRKEPYRLDVELARGKLNEVRNQLADWRQLGLEVPKAMSDALSAASRAFAKAATSQDLPIATVAGSEALRLAFAAAKRLVVGYAHRVLERRRTAGGRLTTTLGCGLVGDPKNQPWGIPFVEAFGMGRITCSWGALAPVEGKLRWEAPDAQIHWCRSHGLSTTAGPLLDLHPGAVPDWLWLWEGDAEEVATQALDFVRQVVGRYRGKVATWHVVARPGSTEVLGLGEEAQIRLAARAVQVARQIDPNATFVVDVDRPWGEWLSSGKFQVGPLHVIDSLARADIGLGGIGLEIAAGYDSPGSPMRDLFDLSRLLDLYSLVGLPLHVSFAFPAAAEPDPLASSQVTPHARPGTIDPLDQKKWGSRAIALAAAKPFVNSITWLAPSDEQPHLYAHSGLCDADGEFRPLLGWLQQFRREYLE